MENSSILKDGKKFIKMENLRIGTNTLNQKKLKTKGLRPLRSLFKVKSLRPGLLQDKLKGPTQK